MEIEVLYSNLLYNIFLLFSRKKYNFLKNKAREMK